MSAGHFGVQADEHVLGLDAPVVGERPFEAAAERPGRLALFCATALVNVDTYRRLQMNILTNSPASEKTFS